MIPGDRKVFSEKTFFSLFCLPMAAGPMVNREILKHRLMTEVAKTESFPKIDFIIGNPINPTLGYIIINAYRPLSSLATGRSFAVRKDSTGRTAVRIRQDAAMEGMWIWTDRLWE